MSLMVPTWLTSGKVQLDDECSSTSTNVPIKRYADFPLRLWTGEYIGGTRHPESNRSIHGPARLPTLEQKELKQQTKTAWNKNHGLNNCIWNIVQMAETNMDHFNPPRTAPLSDLINWARAHKMTRGQGNWGNHESGHAYIDVHATIHIEHIMSIYIVCFCPHMYKYIWHNVAHIVWR